MLRSPSFSLTHATCYGCWLPLNMLIQQYRFPQRTRAVQTDHYAIREPWHIGVTFSFWSAVKTAICRSVTFDHSINWDFHWATETLNMHNEYPPRWNCIITTHEDVQSTRHDFLIVQAAVIPTRVFPAPHGSTMIPERARLTANVSVRGIYK